MCSRRHAWLPDSEDEGVEDEAGIAQQVRPRNTGAKFVQVALLAAKSKLVEPGQNRTSPTHQSHLSHDLLACTRVLSFMEGII